MFSVDLQSRSEAGSLYWLPCSICAPDSLDLMVAINFANMAVNLTKKGVSGRMVALSGGKYTDIPISTVTSGQKRVDVRELYDVDEYRPKAETIVGKPMFLY